MAGPGEFNQATDSELASVRGVCLDIDETLSTRGKLTAGAYEALWSLKETGFAVVPVTGRPAGWCDHIARFWPVDAVVGENGAFTFYMEEGVRRRVNTPMGKHESREAHARLERLARDIQGAFPHAAWASDQKYREFDLAVDFREDVRPWERSEVDRLVEFARSRGAHAKVSSIHVNIWYGDYDKAKGLRHWLAEGAPGLGEGAPAWEQWLYIGDSPNDEPLFEAFDLSVGVANLRGFLDRIEHAPRWLTSKESGAGFAEMAARLVALSGAS